MRVHLGHLANLLTAVRLALIPVLVTTQLTGRWGLTAAGFVLAVATDLADGPLARRSGTSSARGALFDHGTDALFVTALLVAFAWLGDTPALLPWLVMGAFLQYMWDSRAHAGAQLRGSRLGRCNGIAYFVLAGALLVSRLLQQPPTLALALMAAGWLLVASTLWSMVLRWRGSQPG